MEFEVRPRPEKLRVRPVRMPTGQLMWICEGRKARGWGYSPGFALRMWSMNSLGARMRAASPPPRRARFA